MTGGPLRRGDAARVYGVPLLTTFLVLLLVLPARLVVEPLGGAGSPAQLVGLVCLLAAAVVGLSRWRDATYGAAPVAIAMMGFVLTIFASYLAANLRPLDSVELLAADRGILQALSWLGVLLVAGGSIQSVGHLERLLRRLVVAGGGLGLLGVLQFVTHKPLVDYIVIPGLSLNSAVLGVPFRNGYARPAATSVHPIEFGVVLTIVLPIALHFALCDAHRPAWRRWWPVVAVAAAIPLAISRSALLGTAVVLLVLLPTWSRGRRRACYAAVLLAVALVYALVPGLLGTLQGLFTGISSDDSALSRTNGYTLAFSFIARSPMFGRGVSTFLPSYRILDNQFLLTMIETGVVGVTALVLLFVTAGYCLRAVVRLRSAITTVSLAHSLTAALAAALSSFFFFDALSFPQVSGLTFLLIGAAGAVYRQAAGAAVAQLSPTWFDLDRLGAGASFRPEAPTTSR